MGAIVFAIAVGGFIGVRVSKMEFDFLVESIIQQIVDKQS